MATQTVLNPSGEQFEIAFDGQRAVVVEVGGGLRTYAVDGRDVHRRLRRPTRWRSAGRGQVLDPVAQPAAGRELRVRRDVGISFR